MRLTLVPLDSVPVPLVKKVAARLRRIVPWTIKTSPPLTGQLCGNQQEQVDAREVLLLLPEGERHNMLTVGITDDDLTVPGLDFVYGHAMPERRAGVVSLHRLFIVTNWPNGRPEMISMSISPWMQPMTLTGNTTSDLSPQLLNKKHHPQMKTHMRLSADLRL